MTLEDYLKDKGIKNETKENKKSYRESIIKRTLLTTTLVLLILIINNISPKFKKELNKNLFETNYNFSKVNNLYKKYLLNITKKETAKPVWENENLEYYNVEDYNGGAKLSVSENYNVKMLESGLVVFIGNKEEYGMTVIVQQSNGINVTYGNVEAKDIKIYDYIEKGTIIGVANKTLYLKFESEKEVLDYNTYIK